MPSRIILYMEEGGRSGGDTPSGKGRAPAASVTDPGDGKAGEGWH